MNDTFQHPGRWHDFILTPEHRPASEPLTHIMSYTIKNLVPGAYYEAIVQAKNRYGWNEVYIIICWFILFFISFYFILFLSRMIKNKTTIT